MKLTNLLIQTFLPDLPRATSDYPISKKKKKNLHLFVCLSTRRKSKSSEVFHFEIW